MVQSGEVLLQQLQLTVETRVTSQKEPFHDQYELASFLRKKYQLKQSSTEQYFIPFQILKNPGLDSPMALSEKLEGWHPVEPIAFRLLDHIIADHGENAPSQPENSLSLKPKPIIMDEGWQQVLDIDSETFTGSYCTFISTYLVCVYRKQQLLCTSHTSRGPFPCTFRVKRGGIVSIYRVVHLLYH